MTEETFTPKKDYFAPMHTAEHILNQAMLKMFGCERSKNTHIEKNKSKCDYRLPAAPAEAQIAEIEKTVNDIISQNLPVTDKNMPLSEAAAFTDISKLPANVGETVRVVFVGEYDACPCIGAHVQNTSEIGRFKINTWTYENGVLRIRYKLESI